MSENQIAIKEPHRIVDIVDEMLEFNEEYHNQEGLSYKQEIIQKNLKMK